MTSIRFPLPATTDELQQAAAHAAPSAAAPLPDEPEIVALVDRAVRRDRQAFAELYDRFLTPVYRYLYYRTGVVADAEDLSEQVFLQAWAAVDRFRWVGKPFRSWLYTLAHHALVDHRRRARPTQSLDDADYPLDVPSPTALGEFSRWIDAELLAGAISRLTPDQQQVIVLKFVDGMDNGQIATLLNKREGTIRALQMRGLQRLRRDLERQGERGCQ
jgi:RNA polymerase sigma-70 factor, ECF subfamily